MATYAELKARVAMLKRADKEEVVSRKAVAAQEAAEVARCVRVLVGGDEMPSPRPTRPPLPASPNPRPRTSGRRVSPPAFPHHMSRPRDRAKAELLSREKENDARLANARQSLDQATARSRKMREQYEEKARRSRLEIKRLTKHVENAKTETENAVRAAEEKHAAHLAAALEDAARAFAKREADLRKKLARAEANTVEGFEEMRETCASEKARAFEANAARELAERRANDAEEASRKARVDMAEAVTSASQSAAARLEETVREHARVLAAVDARVRSTTDALRAERDALSRKLRESRDREAAMSRVLTEQAARLLTDAET